eukprot:jgi/Galph1/1959/GphlegSOOS_G661.1
MAKYQGAARGGVSDDPKKVASESAEFPILCESCLGPNPYLRMLKDSLGEECKVCTRPFTSFRWKPGGAGTRYKKTEVCQTCARLKHICQTCLFDLRYGLPVQVRDQAIAEGDRQATLVPKSDVNREYFAEQADRLVQTGNIEAIYSQPPTNPIVEKLARKEPRYHRNLSHICSFYQKGECKRGALCPYRHEKAPDDEQLSVQRIKNRYYGINDPLAEKMLRSMGEKTSFPEPPTDPKAKTIFVGGVGSLVSHEEISEVFEKFGEIQSIKIIREKSIAFSSNNVQQQKKTMESLYGRLSLGGQKVFLNWAQPHEENDNLNDPSTMLPEGYNLSNEETKMHEGNVTNNNEVYKDVGSLEENNKPSIDTIPEEPPQDKNKETVLQKSLPYEDDLPFQIDYKKRYPSQQSNQLGSKKPRKLVSYTFI